MKDQVLQTARNEARDVLKVLQIRRDFPELLQHTCKGISAPVDADKVIDSAAIWLQKPATPADDVNVTDDLLRIPATGPPGPSSGEFRGANAGSSPEHRLAGGGPVPELNVSPADGLELSDEAKQQFVQRGRMLSHTADSELLQALREG